MPRQHHHARTAPVPSAVTSTPANSENERFAALCARMGEVEPIITAMAERAEIDPDDVVAETYVRAWKRCGDLATLDHAIRNLKAYLVRIAEHVIADTLRRSAADDRRLAGAAAHPDLPALISLDRVVEAHPDDHCGATALYGAAAPLNAEPHQFVELALRDTTIAGAIKALPHGQRIALLNAIARKPIRATATRLGLKPAAAYRQLQRARAALAVSLRHAGFSIAA